MKKFKICFSTTELIMSKAIREVQDLDVSHAYCEWYDERYDETLVYEARGLDTHIINREKFDEHTQVIYEFETEVNEDTFILLMKYIYNDIGTPYGWKELFGFLVKHWASLIGIKMKNPFPSNGKVCSEAIGNILCIFFGVQTDVSYDDMDLIWTLQKCKKHSQFKMIKGK